MNSRSKFFSLLSHKKINEEKEKGTKRIRFSTKPQEEIDAIDHSNMFHNSMSRRFI